MYRIWTTPASQGEQYKGSTVPHLSPPSSSLNPLPPSLTTHLLNRIGILALRIVIDSCHSEVISAELRPELCRYLGGRSSADIFSGGRRGGSKEGGREERREEEMGGMESTMWVMAYLPRQLHREGFIPMSEQFS